MAQQSKRMKALSAKVPNKDEALPLEQAVAVLKQFGNTKFDQSVEIAMRLGVDAKQADQIRKQGGFIPGIRPGPQTERFLAKTVNRLTLPGSLFLAVIALLPSVILAVFNVTSFPFGGTTVLIAVGVALETMKQIDSQLMLRNYEGFSK